MPKGLSLMNSPDGSQKALAIASLDDSDGNLSLAATPDWSPDWIPKGPSPLPPNMVRLSPTTTGGPMVTVGKAEAFTALQETARPDEDLHEGKVKARGKSVDSQRSKQTATILTGRSSVR